MLQEFKKITKEIRENEIKLFESIDEEKQQEWLESAKSKLKASKCVRNLGVLLDTLEEMRV